MLESDNVLAYLFILTLGVLYSLNLKLRALAMMQRATEEIYQFLMQANNEALPEGLTVPESFSDLMADMRANPYDAKTFALKMKAMVCLASISICFCRHFTPIFLWVVQCCIWVTTNTAN